ncbi:MAG: monofunctional biosynthetic peptidoglycan transglycosylase [Alloprevotella sp.]
MARKFSSAAGKQRKGCLTRLWHFVGIALLVFFVGSVLSVLLFRWVPVPVTPLMIIRNVQQLADGRPVKTEHRWVPLDSISPYLPIAVIASEDGNFRHHNGFDFNAIGQALIERERGGRQRGGSTISQQTAKNVFLWPSSSWLRKGFEAYFTVLIEALWPKDRILEVYLNSIEMGEGIYGAEAVARENFGCPASELGRGECALIAATLPNPRRFSSKEPGPYMKKRRKAILREMNYVERMEQKDAR